MFRVDLQLTVMDAIRKFELLPGLPAAPTIINTY